LPRLFLHIGYPKTGTTGLQRYLSLNAEALKQRGILYPQTGRVTYRDSGGVSDAHYGASFALDIGHYEGNLAFPPVAEMKAQLALEVAGSGCDRVVLSSEYFITAKHLRVIADFLEGYEVTVVVYLRRHDHAFESAYNQALKYARPAPWNATIEAFILYQQGIQDVPYDYLETIERWASVFGGRNIVVRPFEKAPYGRDIYADFLDVIGLAANAGVGDDTAGTHGLKAVAQSMNESVSHPLLVAIRSVRAANIAADVQNQIVAKLLLAKQTEKPVRYLSSPMRNAIYSRHRRSYETIARKFLVGERSGGGDRSLLFNEPAPTPDAPWSRPAEPTPEETMQRVLTAAAALIKP
jgi:hypothetical protein